MLVFTLKPEEGARITVGGQEVIVFIGDVQGRRVKLMTDAPKDVRVERLSEEACLAARRKQPRIHAAPLPGRQFARAPG